MKQIVVLGKYIKHVLIYKIWNVKTATLLLLMFFINYLYCKPILDFSADANYPVTPWVFPFMLSNIFYLALFMIGVLYYFSDVPFMQYPNMYQVIRVGRKKWAIGQIFSIVVQSFFLIVANMGMTVLLLSSHLDLNFEWGKLLHTAALTNIDIKYGFLFGFSYEAMQLYTPLDLMFLTLVLGALVLSFTGILMFALSLIAGRIFAMAMGTGMVGIIFALEGVPPILVVGLGKIGFMNWLRVAQIGVKEHGSFLMPSFEYMVTVLIMGILSLSLVINWRIRHVDFEWIKED
ncbi:MAG: hypothetical protein FWE59_01205 [Oscillospiraceae bacterium]|nr:hypothetical protein [Oscillospiraceae bacterium]